MTAKRFTTRNGVFYTDTKTGYEFQCYGEVANLLNEYAEENEQLKSEYKVLHTQYQDLKKFVKNNFDEHLTQEKLNRQIIKLSEENEQLKKQLELYGELYPTGKWICDLNSDELKKELEE